MNKVNLGRQNYILGSVGRVNRAIEWKEGAVCYAHGKQWYLDDSESEFMLSSENRDHSASLAWVLSHNKFQLNEPLIGDYIPKSELDIEQKYNDAVEEFGLFGFEFKVNISDFTGFKYILGGNGNLTINYEGFIANHDNTSLRELAYNQLMVIGKLKRLMNERDKVNTSEKPNSSEFKDGDKYIRTITGLDGTKTTVDVYRVLDAFNTGCAATDHAIKKMLCAGLRGHKDKLTDYDNAIESLQAAKELLMQKGNNANNTN